MKIFLSTLLFLLAIGSCNNQDEPEVHPLANHGIIEETSTKIVFNINGVSFNMIKVEKGLFIMGKREDEPDAQSGNLHPHQVYLSDYLIGETEVTQELWKAVMGGTYSSRHYVYQNNFPMGYISWDECQEFIQQLNALTQLNFHLPSEAQWEFAARGGNHSKGYLFSGSNNIDEVAWYGEKSYIQPVALKKPNELGIYDMSGNVWEWCQDTYNPYDDFDKTETIIYDPIIDDPNDQSTRILRGGSYYNDEYWCYVYGRWNQHKSTYNWQAYGFRIALTL